MKRTLVQVVLVILLVVLMAYDESANVHWLEQAFGLVVLAGHRIAQGGGADEVLQQHDVAGVGPQVVDQCAVGGVVASTGASDGRIATGRLLAISVNGGNVTDSTAASAIQNPMTTHGHRSTKAPTRPKRPVASGTVAPAPRDIALGYRQLA